MLLTLTFLFVILIFWLVAFIRRYTLLLIIGGAFWFLFAIHEYSLSTTWDIHRGMAMIASLMALLSWVLPYTWRSGDVDIEPEPELTGMQKYMKRRKKVKDAAREISGEEDDREG